MSTLSQAFAPSEFYIRQVVLPELGRAGQERLWQSKAAVVGIGGIGSVSALYLALAGVRRLRLIDQDTVELHNLHRQALYAAANVLYPKVEVAAQRLEQINPEVRVEAVAENLRRSNVDALIQGFDCVVDGLDNMRTRYVLNAACVRYGIPYVYGGAIGMEGNVSVFHPPSTPCLECVFPGVDDSLLPTCETRGILGATAGTIGAIQAMEAIKLLSGIEGRLVGRLLICDLKYMEILTVQLAIRPDCPVCQVREARPLEVREAMAWLCGSATANVNPPVPMNLNLQALKEQLAGEFKILASSPMVVVFQYRRGVEVSLFRQGRMLIKNVRTEQEALEVFHELMERVRASG